MHPLTKQLLDRLWIGVPPYRTIAARLRKECQSMSPAEAAVIVRDLILRRDVLFTNDFHMAAWLASDGEAGNDGFLDFTDCAALLPEERYQRILADPDELVDDPVSSGFEELRLIGVVSSVFDNALCGGNDDGLLHYLVMGDKTAEYGIDSETEEDVKKRLPRLHAKFGHLLRPSQSSHASD